MNAKIVKSDKSDEEIYECDYVKWKFGKNAITEK